MSSIHRLEYQAFGLQKASPSIQESESLATINKALEEAWENLLSSASRTQSFPPILTLNELLPPPSQAAALKILALDLDNVLIRPDSDLGTPLWRNWIVKKSGERNLDAHWHADLSPFFSANIKKRCVEDSETVNKLIDTYKQSGWKVVILTAREHDEVTPQQLEACGIRFPSEDIIYTDHAPKARPLYKWVVKQPEYSPETPIVVRFGDDQIENCQDVHLLHKLENITAECFHYNTMNLQRPWETTDLQRMLIQYALVGTENTIPSYNDPIDNDLVTYIQSSWKIEELNEETLFEIFYNDSTSQ